MKNKRLPAEAHRYAVGQYDSKEKSKLRARGRNESPLPTGPGDSWASATTATPATHRLRSTLTPYQSATALVTLALLVGQGAGEGLALSSATPLAPSLAPRDSTQGARRFGPGPAREALLPLPTLSTVAKDFAQVPVYGSALAPTDASEHSVAALPLKGCSAALFTLETKVGDDHFNLIFDTGSADIVVPTPDCTGVGKVSPRYVPSKEAISFNTTLSALYGSMAFNGTQSYDRVAVKSLANATTLFFSAHEAATPINTVSCEALEVVGNGRQGIFGAAPGTLSSIYAPSFFLDALESKTLPYRFATHLCERGGFVLPGGINPAHVTGPEQYTPSYGEHYTIDMLDFKLGDVSIPLQLFGSGSPTVPTIVDSGSNIIALPPLAKLWVDVALQNATSKIFGTQQSLWEKAWVCAPTSSPFSREEIDAIMPRLTLTMPSEKTGESFSISMPATRSYLQPYTLHGKPQYCSLLSTTGSTDYVLLGNPAQMEHVVMYDVANSRIGFAPQNSAACNSIG